jgi:hypothetical protein
LLKVQRKSPIKAAVHQVICSLKMIPVLNHEKQQQTHCGNSHIQVIIAAKILINPYKHQPAGYGKVSRPAMKKP